jgi:hypothetical protein
MDRVTQVLVAIYFVVQTAFQTFLSSHVSEKTRWAMYWIFIGMAFVLIVDSVLAIVRNLRKTSSPSC